MTEDERQHDPFAPTPAFSRDLVRRVQRQVPTTFPARDLEDPLARRSLVESYLEDRSRPRSSARVFATLGLGALAAAIAHLMPLPYAGAGALALAIATLGLGAVSLQRRARRRRRPEINDAALVHHLDRAIFNAGDRWERMSTEEQRHHLEEDLRLLLEETRA